MDRSGLGLGREFYIPVEQSMAWTPDIYSRLHVIAFNDSTEVTVTRIPRSGGEETDIWQGVLNQGEFYRYTCPLNDQSAHAVYHVVASLPVSTSASCYDRQGSDFFPVRSLFHSGTTEDPLPPPASSWKIAGIGTEITLSYTNHPSGFRARVFDASGRTVDNIESAAPSGTLTWGRGFAPGVYFVRDLSGNPGRSRKVLLIK
jgi:hypothetical protein